MIIWAKKRMLVGPARGSVAGSLVAYVLRITEVDPLEFGLLFERFIDVTRHDPPDIDIDFPDEKKPVVVDYLIDKYGEDYTSLLGTISTFKPNSSTFDCVNHLWGNSIRIISNFHSFCSNKTWISEKALYFRWIYNFGGVVKKSGS